MFLDKQHWYYERDEKCIVRMQHVLDANDEVETITDGTTFPNTWSNYDKQNAKTHNGICISSDTHKTLCAESQRRQDFEHDEIERNSGNDFSDQEDIMESDILTECKV